MKQSKLKPITWKSYVVAVANILSTPGNYKIKTDLGKARLKASLESFGLAGSVVCNWAGKLGDVKKVILIDGNSRVEDARGKFASIAVSLPDRILTPAEYKEMSAMFDFAKAGEVDLDRIESELGTTSDFFEKYKLEVPSYKLGQLGTAAGIGPAKGKPVAETVAIEPDEFPVTLFFNKKHEAVFRKCEDVLKKKYKSISTSDTVLKALQQITKIKK